jgi:hypothetical protein
MGVCTLLLGFPWESLEPWREKCGDRFPSVGLEGTWRPLRENGTPRATMLRDFLVGFY